MNILWIFYLCTILCHWNFVSAKVTSDPTIHGPDSRKEGEHLLWNCTANCVNSSCEYTWNSSMFTSPKKNQTLDITVNRTYDDVVFTCTAKDTVDNDKKSASKKLSVFYGPDKVTVAAGSSITVVEGELSDKRNLTCKALNCNPKCDFTWTRNEKNVSYTTALFPTNRQILRDNSSSYTCTASNVKTGSKASSSVQIKVQYAPDVTLSWKKNENTLICRATGVPNDYTFSKIQQKVEDVLVKRHDVTVSGDTATLNLKDKDYQDTGKYECFVDNGIIHYETKNKTRNKTTQIEVEDFPVLVSSKPSYNVSKGSSLNILITLYSNPVATKAYINLSAITPVFEPLNVEVKFHEKSVNTGGQGLYLNLSVVLEEHFTNYTVYIENTVGNSSTDVTIFPEGPPDIPTSFFKSDISLDSVTFTLLTGFYNGAGQTIVVEHRLEGNQSEWSNKTVKYAGVEKDQRVNLVVTDLTPETVYEFRAFAYNEYSRSGYTEIIKEKTNEAPISAGVIAGAVSASVVLIIIVGVVVVLLILRYRRKEKDIGGGTYNEQNKDLTVEMPVYENNQQHNVCTGEPEQEPHRPSIIYENTMVAVGQEGTRNDGFYDVPPSQVSSSSEQMESNRKDVKENGETIPPYLDLNNPDAVDEAYLGADQSKMFVQQSSAKSNLSDGEYLDVSQSKMLTNVKQDQAVSEDYYLDMNQVKEVKESPKRPKEKESPYVNAQKSNKRKDDSKVNSSKDGMDYQNVAKYKKNKSRTGKEDKPYENTKKEADKGKLEDAEEAKDYQNVNQYKKVPKQQVSVESNSELYMEMSAESSRQSVASIPGYNAPPPPLEEENYMNIRIGKPK